MINSVEFDLQAFEATKKEAEKAFRKLGETPARKVLIEAANDGLVNALRRHFAMREQEMPKSTGFPWFGQPYPKRYFWQGTRDFPGGLRFAFSKTPDGSWLASLVAAGNYKRKDGRLAMTGRGGKDGANDVVYWLVHKVRTRHDPHAMPTQESQLNAATAAVMIAVLKILAKRYPRASM